MRRTAATAARVAAWAVIVAVAAAFVVAVLVPRVAGATPYAVQTGSMRPDYPPGTLVVVRPQPADDVQVGDVITYQLASGEPEVATHRVIGVGANLEGERVFHTQGDANGAPDPAPVREVQVKGALWYAVPHLGRANDLATGDQRQVATYAIAAGLLGYAGWMLAGALRDRVRPRKEALR